MHKGYDPNLFRYNLQISDLTGTDLELQFGASLKQITLLEILECNNIQERMEEVYLYACCLKEKMAQKVAEDLLAVNSFFAQHN